MNQDLLTASAQLELWVSMLVVARNKQHARDSAAYRLNDKTIQLAGIELVDRQGDRHPFRVRQVKYVEWLSADATEFSQRYRVVGRMELSLAGHSPKWSAGMMEDGELTLPHSALGSRPILAVPTTRERLFVQVRRQRLKWIPEPNPKLHQI